MKKQLVLTLCIVGLILGSATLADAGKFTWTVLTHSDAATKGPGADWLVGSGSDPTDNCNFNPVKTCSSGTAPTIGSYSYTWLDGPQTKSCALGTNQGKTCDTNADCGGITGVCVTCQDSWFSYFGQVPGQTKGTGTFEVCQENGTSFTITKMGIGATESVAGSGAGCLVQAGTDKSGSCAVGALTSKMDLELWSLGCAIKAGAIPDIELDGRLYQKGTYPAGVTCMTDDATPTQWASIPTSYVSGLFGKVPSATYMFVACESQNSLPELATACISGAQFKSIMIAYTTADAATFDCAADCGGGCLMGAAEEAE